MGAFRMRNCDANFLNSRLFLIVKEDSIMLKTDVLCARTYSIVVYKLISKNELNQTQYNFIYYLYLFKNIGKLIYKEIVSFFGARGKSDFAG